MQIIFIPQPTGRNIAFQRDQRKVANPSGAPIPGDALSTRPEPDEAGGRVGHGDESRRRVTVPVHRTDAPGVAAERSTNFWKSLTMYMRALLRPG